MSYQQERDQALMALAKAGFSLREARQLLSLGTTLHRHAEGQCSGYWPWDNGERETVECARCGSGCAHRATRLVRVGPPLKHGQVWERVCPDCRAEDRVRALLAGGPTRVTNTRRAVGAAPQTEPAWIPYFQGDPRGCVLYIYPAGTPQDEIDNGRARGSGIAIVGRY
jgi:hypothetical protein